MSAPQAGWLLGSTLCTQQGCSVPSQTAPGSLSRLAADTTHSPISPGFLGGSDTGEEVRPWNWLPAQQSTSPR